MSTQGERCDQHDAVLVWCNDCIRIDRDALQARVAALEAVLRDALHDLPDKYWDAYETLKAALHPDAGGA